MNKYDTAIAEIRQRAGRTLKTPLSEETARLAIEAMEKQIPKRVMPFSERNLGTKICPSCKNICVYWEENYCDKCGQALDWSGENG